MNGKFVVNEQFEKHYNQAVVNIAGSKAYGSGARHAADSTGVSLKLSGVTSLAFVQIGKKLFQISAFQKRRTACKQNLSHQTNSPALLKSLSRALLTAWTADKYLGCASSVDLGGASSGSSRAARAHTRCRRSDFVSSAAS